MSVEDECPNIEARIAGLRELGRISDYSEAYHITAMETICSYLRLNASRNASDLKADEMDLQDGTLRPFRPRPDIVLAMQILGGRTEQRMRFEKSRRYWINVNHTTLRQIDLWNVKLARTSLSTVDFTEAYLADVDFELAWLHCSVFDRAVMKNCNLNGAALPRCNLKGAVNLQYEQVTRAFGVKSGNWKTILPDEWEPPEDWFEPSSPDLSPSDFFDEFDLQYAEFCKRSGMDFIASR